MFPSLGPGEMVVVLIVAVVLFGKRLPEVGRSLGKGIVQFKKGLRGIEDELESATREVPRRADAFRDPEYATPIPKFEPPTSPPILQPASDAPPFRD